MTVALLVLTALAMLALSAFCSGMETGLLSVSRERVLHLAREGGRKAQVVQRALADLARTTTTILIGNNLANVTYSSASSALILLFFADSTAQSVASFIAAFLVLYFSEFMPKLLCAARPLRRTLQFAPAYRVFAAVLSPLTALAMRFTDLFLPRREQKYRLTAADLVRILQDRKDGVCLSDIESALITRIIVLRVKNRPITPESILSALRDSGDVTCAGR